MRILMSGGVKTQNIINAIEKQFKASGDEFIVVEYLDDVNNIFAMGDYFDKAIIAEQSINRDYTITDEYEIRRRVNDFANECAKRQRKVSYVFFTQMENMAYMIYEEILPILDISAVVLKTPPYYATFFNTIIINDIGQLPQDIVYVPENITMDMPDDTQQPEDDPFLTEFDPSTETMVPDADPNFGEDIFGDSPDFIGGGTIGDLGNDIGEEMPLDDEVMPIDEDEGDDGIFMGDQPLDDGNNGGFDPYALPDDFDADDSSIDMSGNLPGERSGDLPDYTIDNGDASYLPGFDNEDDPLGEEDLYGPENAVPDQWGGDDQYNQQYNGYGNPNDIPIAPEDNGQDYDPLGQQLYGGETQNVQSEPNPYAMYDDMANQQNQVDQPYDPGYGPGFAPDDYADAEQTSTSNRVPTGRQPIGKKHRGLGGLLGGRQQEDQSMMTMGMQNIGSKDIRKVKDALKPFAARGNSIVVTGCGGCGTSTIAFHLANIISQIGYTVLLVDMDTEGRTQGYISKASYDSMDTDGSNLMSAVNSSTNTNSNAVVVKTGFHLLTMGLGTDVQPIEEQLHKEKIARFVSVVKTGYNFVIYDVPFRHAINFLSDITFMCDNLVLVTDASNWGVTKTMLSVCNIDSDDMQDTIFHRAQLVFNKYRNLSKLFGLRVKTCDDIVQAMDRKVLDLVGDDIGLNFSRMSIAGIVNDDPMFENGWYDDVQYSDTKKGQDVFIDLIESIVLKKH